MLEFRLRYFEKEAVGYLMLLVFRLKAKQALHGQLVLEALMTSPSSS